MQSKQMSKKKIKLIIYQIYIQNNVPFNREINEYIVKLQPKAQPNTLVKKGTAN